MVQFVLRTYSMSPRTAIVVISLAATGCVNAEELEGSSAAVESADDKGELRAGHYKPAHRAMDDERRSVGSFDLAVGRGGELSGDFYYQTLRNRCRFTFRGVLQKGARQAEIVAVDAESKVEGTLKVTRDDVELRLDKAPKSCSRSGVDAFGAYRRSVSVAADVVGYRTVAATRAFVYDAPSGSTAGDFEYRGESIEVIADETDGFVRGRLRAVKGNGTAGFFRVSDLAPVDRVANVSRPSVAPGKYLRADGTGWALVVNAPPGKTVLSNPDAVLAAGTENGEHDTLRAVLPSSCQSYALTALDEQGTVVVSWDGPVLQPFPDEAQCRLPVGTYKRTAPAE